jgi:hypothetical protein
VQTQVQAFVDGNARSMLVPAIKRSLKQGSETSALEQRLKANLADFADDAELRALPLGFLTRVISFTDRVPAAENRVEFDRIFAFCLRVLDERGSEASVLFHGLDLGRCSAGQIHELHSRAYFLWAFVADSFPSTLIGLASTAAKYRELFEAEHSEMERLQIHQREMARRLEAQQRELAERLQTEHRAAAERLQAESREMAELCARQGRALQDLSERVEWAETSLAFPLKIGPPPDGIVAYLTRKHGGNPATKGVVTVTLSSTWEVGRMGPNVFDFMTDTNACAGRIRTEAQWIDFDFHEMRVRPTHYWIRSYAGFAHLKSWVLQCVDDSDHPVNLDEQTDTVVLNSSYAIATFAVAHPRRCSIIRLKTTGHTHISGNWRVIISGFELFGSLRE